MRAITIILIILTSCAKKKDVSGVVKDKWHQEASEMLTITTITAGSIQIPTANNIVTEEAWILQVENNGLTSNVETDEITWNMTNLGDTINTK